LNLEDAAAVTTPDALAESGVRGSRVAEPPTGSAKNQIRAVALSLMAARSDDVLWKKQ
jgi:hypothetical protein